MREPASAGAAGRRFPRLSLPGGLLLTLCLFLPAVKGCDKPIYPYEVPAAYAPYLFGLLAFALALWPVGRKAVVARFVTWALGTIAALAEGYFFLSDVLSNSRSQHRLLWLLLSFWLPLVAFLATSVRRRNDLERWRVQLLWSGGGLCLLFFVFFIRSETVYYGLWLAALAAILLIIEGVGGAVTIRLRRP